MKNRLAIIGASYLQLPLIEKAKELGYETHVFAWKMNDVGEKASDYFYPISIVDKEIILEKCKDINICGICSIASDLATVTVNYVANALGLPGNSNEATTKSTNKHLMRMAFMENGDPSPKSYQVDLGTDLNELKLEFPVIVKPTDRSGSRGISKVDRADELKLAVEAALNESFEKKALVEEFVGGQEYSVECITYRGIHHFLALTKKFTTGAPHFIETGHIEPATVDNIVLDEIRKVVFHALDSLEIKNSASHSEIKISPNGDIKIIEIGGRMGGGCIGSDLVRYSTGVDFVKAVIQVACGEEPDLLPQSESVPVGVRFIFSQKDVEEMEVVRKENRLLRLADFNEDYIGKVTDDSNRAGCYIFKL